MRWHMLEMILAAILVIGSIGAVAQGSELQEELNITKCVEKVSKATRDSENIPATIEICHTRDIAKVLSCKTNACVQDLIDEE